MGKINVKNVLPGCVFTVLLFLVCLDSLTNVAFLQTLFKHIDEVLVLGCLVYLVLHIHYVFRKKWLLLYFWLGFLAVGAVSSLIFRYQALIPAVIDAVVVIGKFMIGYLAAYVYASLHKGCLTQRLIGAARIIAVVIFLIAVHDILLPPFFPRGEYRYFTQSLVLMFPHSTYLAAAMVTLLILLGYHNQNKHNLPYMLMVTFIGMMTLRSKAIAFFALYWLLYVCIIVFKNRNYPIMMAVGSLGCIAISFQQISDYFLTTSRFSPRQIMLRDSIQLAAEHFPLGTGFGSFGSTMAAQYYSSLYEQLGYQDYDGMSSDFTAYLTDSFWPEIIAQFGLFGTILFICVIACLIHSSINVFKKNSFAGFSLIVILLNMLINSVAESSFFNPASFLLFILFGLFEAESSKQITPSSR